MVDSLNEVSSKLLELYREDTSITISGADLTELFAGALETALKSPVQLGVVFKVLNAVDTTNLALEAVKSINSTSVSAVGAADLVAFFPNNLQTALGSAPEKTDVFKLTASLDTSDTALATAKGSTTADGDLFEVTSSGTPAVKYLGTTLPVAGDLFVVSNIADPAVTYIGAAPSFTGTESKDFISIGS